jgi:hypothetical protein
MAGLGHGMPTYSYAANNPNLFTDPDGLIIHVDSENQSAFDAMRARLTAAELETLRAFEEDPSRNIHIGGPGLPSLHENSCGGASAPRTEKDMRDSCRASEHPKKGWEEKYARPENDVDVMIDFRRLRDPVCAGIDRPTVIYHELFGHVFPNMTWRGWSGAASASEEAFASGKTTAFQKRLK